MMALVIKMGGFECFLLVISLENCFNDFILFIFFMKGSNGSDFQVMTMIRHESL